jgi:flagellar motility protein MotE (MotC chaperone)
MMSHPNVTRARPLAQDGPAGVLALALLAPGALAQQAPPPTMEEEIRAFCGNIADAARDQRYLLQKKELEELQAGSRRANPASLTNAPQYRDWLKKREEFMRVAESQLVDIYKNMRS